MPINHKFYPATQIGREPSSDGKGKDGQFYEWIAGGDSEKASGQFLLWLIDDLREETDITALQSLLDDWHARCTPKEFAERLEILRKLLPSSHPIHPLVQKYQKI